MNTQDCVKIVAKETGVSQEKTQAVIRCFLDTIVNGARVDGVATFGSDRFKHKHVPARKCRNPRNGEEMTVPARDEVRFRRRLS